MRDHADVVVIGAGTTGASVAWHLARAGLSVRLLDKGTVASGASGASPGIVRQYYADPALSQLAAQGVRAYREWADHYPGECGYRQTGFLTAVASHEQQATQANIALLRAQGEQLQWQSRSEVQQRVPDLNTEGVAGWVYESEAGYCDPRLTAQSFVAGARALGAQFDRCHEVRGIVCQSGRVTGVQTDVGFIACGHVVNAAGPWSAALAADCAAPLPITATRQCVAIVEPAQTPAEALAPMPGYSDRQAGFYLRPDDSGVYLIGSLLACDSAPIDPDAFDLRMSDEALGRYRDRAALRVRRLAQARPVGRRVSFFDNTPDGNPIIGADPRVSGLVVAAGLSGHGFKFAPLFGQAIARWVQDGQPPQGMEAFAMERFLQ